MTRELNEAKALSKERGLADSAIRQQKRRVARLNENNRTLVKQILALKLEKARVESERDKAVQELAQIKRQTLPPAFFFGFPQQ